MGVTPFLGRKQEKFFLKNEWFKRIAYEYIQIVITYTYEYF